MKEQLISQIIDMISETADIDKEDIQLDSHLINDLSLNSMDLMVLISDLEKRYSISIGESKMRSFTTVQDIVNCVMSSRK